MNLKALQLMFQDKVCLKRVSMFASIVTNLTAVARFLATFIAFVTGQACGTFVYSVTTIANLHGRVCKICYICTYF